MKKSELQQIIREEINKLFEGFENQKFWDEMSDKEKRFVYKKAIDSGNVKDSFEGFSKMMTGKGKTADRGNLFNVKTGKPIEINW